MIKRRNKNTILRILDLDKAINKTIIVLCILLSVLIMKTINSKVTNNLVGKLESGIYYDFQLKRDAGKIKNYITEKIGSSKGRFEDFTIEIFNTLNND